MKQRLLSSGAEGGLPPSNDYKKKKKKPTAIRLYGIGITSD